MLMEILQVISPMALFWLTAMIIFAVAEAATVGLVSIWFAGGALVSLIAAALGAQLWLQIALFLVVSVILLALLRPFLRKFSTPNKVKTNADRHVGATALVSEEINNLKETGAVRLDGVTWTARSETGEVIPAGTLIRVQKISGVKVFVVPAEQAAEIS